MDRDMKIALLIFLFGYAAPLALWLRMRVKIDRDMKIALLILLFGYAASLTIKLFDIFVLPIYFASVVSSIPIQIATIYMIFFSLKMKRRRIVVICISYEVLFLFMMVVDFFREYEKI